MRPPALPAEALEDALVGRPGRFAVELLSEVWGGGNAQGRVLTALRQARWMNSGRRRLVREVLFTTVRGEAWLEAGLRAAGWSGERPIEALWTRALVACGLGPERAGAHFGEAVFGRDPRLPEDLVARLALLASLPAWVLEDIGDLERAERFVGALDDRAPVTLRCVGSRDEIIEALGRDGIQARPTRWARQGIVLDRRTPMGNHAVWKSGRIEVQDEGSQLIAELVKPPRRSRVVDLCAGAGGKSLSIQASAPKGVRVEAYDVRASALKEARKRARRAGFALSTTRLVEGAALAIAPAARVLVDAPCTGTGTLRRRPMLRWRLTPAWRDEQIAAQRDILRRAADIVLPGGRLVYSTCSVLESENQAVVAAFLEERPDFGVVPIAEPLGGDRAARLGGRFLRLEPAVHGSDGFFAAVLQRSPSR